MDGKISSDGTLDLAQEDVKLKRQSRHRHVVGSPREGKRAVEACDLLCVHTHPTYTCTHVCGTLCSCLVSCFVVTTARFG